MKTRLRIFLMLAILSRPALAEDGGNHDGGADQGCVDYAGNPCAPVACDGALCDTTNCATCAMAGGPGNRRAGGAGLPAAVCAALVLAIALRRGRRGAGAVCAIALLFAGDALAGPEPAVDVVLRDPPPPRRFVAIAWNPLPLLFGKVSFDLIIVPHQHHGIVLSPFWASTRTAPIYVFNDAGMPRQLPEQDFTGGGGELGYRYYFGRGGPRGFFLGPSLILGWFTATAQNGTKTPYLQYGFAADAGYHMLIADRVSLSLGGGLQVAATDKPIPPQQFPAKIYANFGVYPRLLLNLGVAL